MRQEHPIRKNTSQAAKSTPDIRTKSSKPNETLPQPKSSAIAAATPVSSSKLGAKPIPASQSQQAMWSSTVGLVNGKHRYLTAETFGFKISSNGQQLKRRQQWTIEPFPENTGPDGSISSAASVSSQCQPLGVHQHLESPVQVQQQQDCILTLAANQLIRNSNGTTSSSSYVSPPGGSAASSASQSEQEACSEEHENVAIKSHLNKYLAVDSFGNVTCDSDEKTENARFTITICSMSQGRSKEEHIFWAFKNVERGYYLGTTDDGMICCNAKMPKSRAELWHLHLLPARGASFFAMKSLGRKRYARVEGQSQLAQVQLDANISWGSATLFQFKYHEGGRYSLLTSDNQLLTNEGKCLDKAAAAAVTVASGQQEVDATQPNGLAAPNQPPAECLFTLEYHSGCLAFRDSFGQYLAAAGRSSILKSRSIGVSRDELFVFESVPIQVSLKAVFNNRWVSIKQGVDLTANQMEVSSKFETFQLTYQRQTQNWSIMTHDCNYWTVLPNSSTVSVCRPGDYEGLTRGQFRLVWAQTDSSFKLKFIDINQSERWLSARKSGQLFLAGPNHEPVEFVMRFQSRRLLNLRPLDASGFLGLKSGGKSQQLEANKTSADPIEIEYSTEEAPVGGNPAGLRPVSERVAAPATGIASGHNQLFEIKLNGHQDKQCEGYNNNNGNISIINELSCDSRELLDNEQFINGIDANNNNCPDAYEKPANGSGVETSSAPSVASIINSFSNAKIGTSQTNGSGLQLSEQAKALTGVAETRPMSSTVSKLASSFESGATTSSSPPVESSDSSSVLTVCSSVSGYSSSSPQNGSNEPAGTTHKASPASERQQVVQSEFCHLKVRATGKYLTVDDETSPNESNIKCDSSSKMGAQSWTLELRSHNSVAIRASDTQAYMQLGTNGIVSLTRCQPEEATLWEF